MLKNKNKIKTIFFISLLIISLFLPIVNAENETDINKAVTISETQNELTIKDGDEYIFRDNATIDYPVDGNLFVFANNVTITSQIGGDAFICANTINIEEDGYILSNLFACSNNINIKGSVYNVYSIGNTLTVDGFVYRDIRSTCNNLNVNGMIGRNVFVDCSAINFKGQPNTEETSPITSYGSIQGNLNYSSKNELSIPDGHISGEVKFSQILDVQRNISDYIYSLGTVLVSAIILWLIGLWLSPKLLHNNIKDLTLKRVLQIIGLGILVPIILTLLSIIILIIPITSQLFVLLLCILVILFFISTSVTIININDILCNKLRIAQNMQKLGFLILFTLVFWLLTLIPYLGLVISFIAIIWGIGSISYSLLIKEKDSTQVKSDKKEHKKIDKSDEKKGKENNSK